MRTAPRTVRNLGKSPRRFYRRGAGFFFASGRHATARASAKGNGMKTPIAPRAAHLMAAALLLFGLGAAATANAAPPGRERFRMDAGWRFSFNQGEPVGEGVAAGGAITG